MQLNWVLPMHPGPPPLLMQAMTNSIFNKVASLLRHFSRVSNLLEAKCRLCSLILSCLSSRSGVPTSSSTERPCSHH